ncbi:hypothetical protein M0R72_19865 [Candidatus Pacearchaeota archaeon]|jgi:hypothetical protein|nr:hypothetical protein [Candidatus Pacearchaeota archaeon]
MPATFEGHASLDLETWLWHRDHPGQLSRLAKDAIRRGIALDSLPDSLRDDALEAATAKFFGEYPLSDDYIVIGQELTLHEEADARDDVDMDADAERLGIPPAGFLDTLKELFDLELEMQMRKRAVLRNAGIP